MRSPVIYAFFNRPEVTRRTFCALRRQRPTRLHLIADGPRQGRPGEAERCELARKTVEELIDWKCEVTRDYAGSNLGAGKRLSSGLTAAFELLGEAIVLEDDILPHPDFFPFCDAMLAAYRNDPHVHAISGFQPLGRYAPAQGPVVPSTFSWNWGWASWQRSWRDYRFDIAAAWDRQETRRGIRDYLGNELNYYGHTRNFEQLAKGQVDAWDFQWTFTSLAHRRVTLVSAVNLILNLGFDSGATHTVKPELYLRDLKAYATVPTTRRRDTGHAERIHDKLFGQIIHGSSRPRIAGIRLLARFPGIARRLVRH